MSNDNPKIEVTLLSKEDVEGKSKVLQKIGRGCGKAYWTSTPSGFSDWNGAYEFSVTSSGELYGWNNVSCGNIGVRPVLKAKNLDELINGCKSEMKDGIQIVEYGQFPNLYEYARINAPHLLRETGKQYISPIQIILPKIFYGEKISEYDYNGKKVIEDKDGNYYPVKPVSFYVDRENSMLISTDVLFDFPIDSDLVHYNGDFKTSLLYDLLNHEFIKDLSPGKHPKASHGENIILDFMTQRADRENIDETKKLLIKHIDRLLKRNAELQAISEEITKELRKLKCDVQGKTYVRK